jgi:UDP-N-acetylglucosamine--N-acetylmuramyl-(pentapeptide) pyrophosphoryl-undecaprenol N-acetylglucosamine transferase
VGSYRFILSGGGTGGHIYPAIAIANEIRRRQPNAGILFVGAKDRMEMEKVPQAGYEIKGLWISGLERKLSLKNILFPIKLMSSLIEAAKIIRKFKPHVVIGTGGFASGPLLNVAAGKGIPCVIQEQNSYAGITNKLLARKVARICVAYDGMDRFFPEEKIVKTGNPVRSNLVQGHENTGKAYDYFGLDPDKATLLVLGGSLGARRINELIASELAFFSGFGMQIIWQCGKLYYEVYRDFDAGSVKVREFVNRMDYAYSVADIIISRAGAGTVSELCLAGKPVILIPSPNVAENHQTRNAEALGNRDAALMIAEKDLETSFETDFKALFLSADRRKTLGTNIRKLAIPDATERIVDEIEKLLP